jgi:hypothetical protein
MISQYKRPFKDYFPILNFSYGDLKPQLFRLTLITDQAFNFTVFNSHSYCLHSIYDTAFYVSLQFRQKKKL